MAKEDGGEASAPGWSALLVLPVMALAFYLAFLPHQGYLYPVHIDDWIHLANAEAIMDAGGVAYTEPFLGQRMIGLGSNLELGYQLFWGVFQRISGLDWITIFRYFPSVLLAMTVLAVYVMARRMGFGWEAAFFAALIPTTVGILGPAFLVPVAMGLLFVALGIFLAFSFRDWQSYLVIFIFTCFLVAIHAPSAICLVIILAPYALLNLREDAWRSLGLGLALLLPFLAPFPWIFGRLLPTAGQLLTPQPLPGYVDFPMVIRTYGYIPVALCLLGTLVLAVRGGRKNYGLVLGFLALLLMLVIFYVFHYGVAIMYERGLMFMMLMTGVLAGAGLMAVRTFGWPAWLWPGARAAAAARYIGWTAAVVLVVVILFVGIPARSNLPYYHMIEPADYQDFVWIRDNVGEEYSRAVLDPWKATPFAAVTGKYVYTRIHAFPTATDEEAARFLREGCADTAFLRDNGISIVYTRGQCRNPDLTEAGPGVYLLEE
jgi:hypothetical protein